MKSLMVLFLIAFSNIIRVVMFAVFETFAGFEAAFSACVVVVFSETAASWSTFSAVVELFSICKNKE